MNSINAQVASILSERWFCTQPNFGLFQGRLMKAYQSSETFPAKDFGKSPEKAETVKEGMYAVDPYWEGRGLDAVDEEGSTIVIYIRDVLTKYDTWWAGAVSIRKTLERAEANQNISTVVLHIDGPGGQALAVRELSKYVRDMQTRTVGYASDMACSAHQNLLAACDVCFANQPLAMVGSIGTYATYSDIKGYFESLGVKIEDIYAPESSEKNEEFRAWMDGDKSLIEADLSKWATDFIDHMKEYRPNVDTKSLDPYKGKTIYAADALRIGLIDGIGTIDDALAYGQNQQANNPTNTNAEMNNPLKGFLDGLKGMMGMNDKNLTAEQISTANEELKTMGANAFMVPATDEVSSAEELNKHLSELSTSLKNEETAHETTKGELAAAKEDKETATTALDAVKAVFGEDAKAEEFDLTESVKALAQYKKDHSDKPAGGGAEGTAGDADPTETEKVSKVDDPNRAHNKMVDAMGLGPKANEEAN
jgi:protease-4